MINWEKVPENNLITDCYASVSLGVNVESSDSEIIDTDYFQWYIRNNGNQNDEWYQIEDDASITINNQKVNADGTIYTSYFNINSISIMYRR